MGEKLPTTQASGPAGNHPPAYGLSSTPLSGDFDLTDGFPNAAIEVDENGVTQGGIVWTNTTTNDSSAGAITARIGAVRGWETWGSLAPLA